MNATVDTKPEGVAQTRAWLTAHYQEIERQRSHWSRLESRWSWARLLVFLAALVPWILWIATPPLPMALTLVSAFVFAGTVGCHHRSRAERELRDGMLSMLEEALQRCGGRVELIRAAERPPDDGRAALDLPPVLDSGPTWSLTDQERDDLDLFARPVGIFGLLNRTSSVLGARRLCDVLDHPCLAADRVRSRQEAVRWLVQHPAERVRVMGAAARLRGEDERLAGFVQAVHQAKVLSLFVPPAALRLWSLLTALAAIMAGFQIALGGFGWAWLLAGVLLANGLILRRIAATLNEALEPWRNVAWGARGFLVAARQAAVDLPNDTLLTRLRASFAAVVRQRGLASLCRRIGWAEHGGVVHGLLNYVLLYDLHVAAAVLKRALPNRAALLVGLSALADLEVLASLACFAAEQPVACFPTPTDEGKVEIVDGVHPLLAPERVVANSLTLTLDTRMWIVTGSNMAGKSTFLRMIGVNVLLAQLGSVVTAQEMSWSPARLVTDLHARDNLAEDESYFLAEVRHLRRMVIPPEGDGALLGLIDEPFRGTNSQEQSAASVALVRHLVRSGNLFLLATHDQHLTTLADGATVRNYHYREDLSRDGLVFDYRLRAGPAQTRNALRVLEREGYPPQMLAEAHGWLAQSTDSDSQA